MGIDRNAVYILLGGGDMKKLQMFLIGAASVFDLDQAYVKKRMHNAMLRLIDPETNKVRISAAASPSGAFMAVGSHLRHAITRYGQQTS
jgi:hypothetical protein